MQAKVNYPKPKNEKQRLLSLYDYQILDTIPEKEYDSITKIAAQICNVPASLITLLDKDRQWFKSTFGFQISETPRAISFCNHTILDPESILVVPDLRNDARFSENPLVTGNPNAVFYAGAPLVTPEGYVLGSICVLDGKANDLNEDQLEALKALAKQVVTKLELHKKIRQLTLTQEKLKEANENLKNFARIVSHDMKTPLANILLMSRSFKSYKAVSGDVYATEVMDLIDSSAKELLSFIDQVLIKSEKTDPNEFCTDTINSADLLNKVIDLIAAPPDIEIKLTGRFPSLPADKTRLQQVFQNIITNAIKYNNKEKGVIRISCESDDQFHHFIFADNGCGIKKNDLQKIFDGKQTSDKRDRYGNKGTGLGLTTVKNIIHKARGKITVTSKINQGSVFRVSLPASL